MQPVLRSIPTSAGRAGRASRRSPSEKKSPLPSARIGLVCGRDEAQRIFRQRRGRGGNFTRHPPITPNGLQLRWSVSLRARSGDRLVLATSTHYDASSRRSDSGGNQFAEQGAIRENLLATLADRLHQLLYRHVWDATATPPEKPACDDELGTRRKVLILQFPRRPACRCRAMQAIAELRVLVTADRAAYRNTAYRNARSIGT